MQGAIRGAGIRSGASYYRIRPAAMAVTAAAELGLGRGFVIGIPYLWLVLFFLVPFADRPEDLLLGSEGGDAALRAAVGMGWRWRHSDQAEFRELQVPVQRLPVREFVPLFDQGGSDIDVLCLLLGYPMAYGIARSTRLARNILLMLIFCRSGRRSCCASMRGSGC